jgi:predicted metalloprotease with PDZ domain
MIGRFGIPAGYLAPAFRRAAFRLLLIAVAVITFGWPASATIEYHVSLGDPSQHVFNVTMTIPAEGKEVVTALPAWNALYRVRDFAYRLGSVRGICPAVIAVPLSKRQLDKQTWRFSLDGPCQPGGHNSFEIQYAIEWNAPGPFNSQLDSHHAFMNLGEILMYVPDRRNEDVSVQFVNLPDGWRTAAELVAFHGPNAYIATSYDSLVDAPVEAGKFEEFEFTESGGHFRVVVDSHSWNKPVLEEALHRITGYELHLMGGAPFDPPYREYTFFFHIGPDGDVEGGGMEHRNSTAISATSTEAAVTVAAHEFFHVWNVKRIRPQSLEPVDYTKEQYTRALWFAEGVTSAYASYALERTGLWSKAQFYSDLAQQIGELQSRPARAWQSVEESSLDSWFEKYDGYNAPGHSISYYNKGQILGVLLDLAIRDATDNHKSLDDVMRRMNAEYAQQGKFYDDSAAIRAVVEEVSGKSFADFFNRYVSGTDEIPYNDFLHIAGLELQTGPGRPSITEVAHPTDRQRRILDGVLRGSTN